MSFERNFYSLSELDQIDFFYQNGYLIFDLEKPDLLGQLISGLCEQIKDISTDKKALPSDLLNDNHSYVNFSELNTFRLKLIESLNSDSSLLPNLYFMAKRVLNLIAGSELSIQRKANLSIQQPGDESSLLDIHSDVWSGNSPYEVVFWLPLVDCYKSKSFYVLPKKFSQKIIENWTDFESLSSEEFYRKVEKNVVWMDLPTGKAVMFSHSIFHGNRINEENETRWSINIRFKSLLSPYHEKSLAETFLPITPKAATKIGFEYHFPRGKKH